MKDALEEEALLLQDLLVPVGLGHLGCKVDASLVGVGEDQLEAEISIFAKVGSLDALNLVQFVADHGLAGALRALENQSVSLDANLVWLHASVACSEVAFREQASLHSLGSIRVCFISDLRDNL